jgi:hypothetical protein
MWNDIDLYRERVLQPMARLLWHRNMQMPSVTSHRILWHFLVARCAHLLKSWYVDGYSISTDNLMKGCVSSACQSPALWVTWRVRSSLLLMGIRYTDRGCCCRQTG